MVILSIFLYLFINQDFNNFILLYSDLTDKNIRLFVAGKVWQKILSKYLDASNYSEFKKFPLSLKSLETFIAESLKIHIEYLIAIHNRKKSSYSEDVLAKIKKLDQLTFKLSIPSASRQNHANELDIDQENVEDGDDDDE